MKRLMIAAMLMGVTGLPSYAQIPAPQQPTSATAQPRPGDPNSERVDPSSIDKRQLPEVNRPLPGQPGSEAPDAAATDRQPPTLDPNQVTREENLKANAQQPVAQRPTRATKHHVAAAKSSKVAHHPATGDRPAALANDVAPRTAAPVSQPAQTAQSAPAVPATPLLHTAAAGNAAAAPAVVPRQPYAQSAPSEHRVTVIGGGGPAAATPALAAETATHTTAQNSHTQVASVQSTAYSTDETDSSLPGAVIALGLIGIVGIGLWAVSRTVATPV